MPDASEWEEKAAIEELIYAYSLAATRNDWDTYETLFASDAVWEMPSNSMRSEGPQDIRAATQSFLGNMELFIHSTHGTVVTLNGDGRASAMTIIEELGRLPGVVELHQYGIAYDEFQKIDGVWKFTHRLMQDIYFEPQPLQGETRIARDAIR